MTLVLSYVIGNQFAVMTSDTRKTRIRKYVDNKTNQVIKTVSTPILDSEDVKVHKLTDYVLLGSAGQVDLCDYLINIFKKEVQDYYDLSDCKKVLKRIVECERQRKGTCGNPNLFLGDFNVGIELNGFYHDGNTGLVTYYSGDELKIQETMCEPGHYLHSFAAPTDDNGIDSMVNNMLNVTQEDGKTFTQSVIEQLKDIHDFIACKYPAVVSTDMVFHTIRLENGAHKHKEFRIDTKEGYNERITIPHIQS